MVLSLLLGVAGITGQIVASRRPIVGWTISLLNQPLWVALALATHQYGLLLLTPGYVAAAGINLRRAILLDRPERTGGAPPAAVDRGLARHLTRATRLHQPKPMTAGGRPTR